jgi:hypothetical protein
MIKENPDFLSEGIKDKLFSVLAHPSLKARTNKVNGKLFDNIAIKNSGNQPEFQSSIKKRTVNQTVCAVILQNF